MKVMFATPAYDGTCHVFMVRSLLAEMDILRKSGIDSTWESYPGCCYLPISRNILVDIFLKSDATDLFFIDADTEWEPGAGLKVLQVDKDIVGGVYPHKNGKGTFPGVLADKDVNASADLVEMAIVPTGFMRIRRGVFKVIDKMCPSLDVIDGRDSENQKTYKCYFDTMKIKKTWWGEDTHFCNIWRAIGGKIWAVPDIEFTHHGFYGFQGNYSKFLRKANV